MKKRIYIAGKVTGLDPKAVESAFTLHTDYLRAVGFLVTNPLEEVNDWHAPWHRAMRTCIAAMMRCDGILMLRRSEDSPGATLERELAEKLQIPVFLSLEAVQKHFGLWNPSLCSHSERRTVSLYSGINCETTVTVCTHCGQHLDEPVIDCA